MIKVSSYEKWGFQSVPKSGDHGQENFHEGEVLCSFERDDSYNCWEKVIWNMKFWRGGRMHRAFKVALEQVFGIIEAFAFNYLSSMESFRGFREIQNYAG